MSRGVAPLNVKSPLNMKTPLKVKTQLNVKITLTVKTPPNMKITSAKSGKTDSDPSLKAKIKYANLKTYNHR